MQAVIPVAMLNYANDDDLCKMISAPLFPPWLILPRHEDVRFLPVGQQLPGFLFENTISIHRARHAFDREKSDKSLAGCSCMSMKIDVKSAGWPTKRIALTK